jgi:polar amino acid transport system substrate-binding protein
MPVAHSAAEACSLRVGWEPYAVFTFAGPKDEPAGVDIEVMREIAKDSGCAVEFRQLPWARILLELANGQIDATTSVKYIPERDAFAYFSVPYRAGELAVFTRRGESGAMPLGQLRDVAALGKKLTVINEYSYGEVLDNVLAEPAVAALTEKAPDYATAIRMLVNGRTDAFLVEDVDVMLAEARALGASAAVERHPMYVPASEYHIMFSRASVSPEVVSVADRTIDRMLRSGRIQALIETFREPH